MQASFLYSGTDLFSHFFGILGTIPATISRYVHRKADAILRNTGADVRETLAPTSTLYVGSTLAYDAEDGRLATVTGDFVGSTPSYAYTYQANSTSDLPDTITGPVHTVDNHWESTRDALDWKENKVGSTTVSKYDYTVNDIGQRTSVAATGSAFSTAPDWNWGYNARGELVSTQHLNTTGSSRHYTFDAIGNRTEHREGTHTSSGGTATSYTPNEVNQYDAIGSLNPVHDLDGNMTSGPLPVVPGALSALKWDGNNQLIELTPNGGSTVRYHYDAMGRRIARTVGSTRTYWTYDGWNPVAEFSGAVHTTGTAPVLTPEKTWLWGPDLSGSLQGAGGVGGLLAVNLETGGTAGVYHPLFDGNGNIAQYLDGSGNAVAKYEYDGFGKSLISTGSHVALFPHRFSTKMLDGESGLYYYGYRYYDPVTGRWPSRDPIGERGGVNLYGFLKNQTVAKFDLLGLLVIDRSEEIPPIPPEGMDPTEISPPEEPSRIFWVRHSMFANCRLKVCLKCPGGIGTHYFRGDANSLAYLVENGTSIRHEENPNTASEVSKSKDQARKNAASDVERSARRQANARLVDYMKVNTCSIVGEPETECNIHELILYEFDDGSSETIQEDFLEYPESPYHRSI